MDHEQRARYLGYRAMLEALDSVIVTSNTIEATSNKPKIVKTKRRGLTKLQMNTYETFKENALNRFDFGLKKDEISRVHIETQLDSLHRQYKDDFKLYEYIVGLQNFLQELLEGFVILDRLWYLREKGFYPNLFNIFDEKISPRNTVIYCTKQ